MIYKKKEIFIPVHSNGFPISITESFGYSLYDHQAEAVIHLVNGKLQKNWGHPWDEPLGVFSVSGWRTYRWKDSVQSEAEIRVWVAEGVANGCAPGYQIFGSPLWQTMLDTVEKIYLRLYRIENTQKYLSRCPFGWYFRTISNYGNKPWQQRYGDHGTGMYHALLENRIPFRWLIQGFWIRNTLNLQLLILPNISTFPMAVRSN